MTGSTALGEALDPEDLRALLRRYYDTARDVVSEHGGTLEKFIGDAVMAVFGLPQAHGDDAARALSAALELRDRVRADARLGARLPIRLGVASGEVVATRGTSDQGDGDFLITGEAVNTAARLQQAAAPWSILVAERALAAAGDRFAVGPVEAVDAKGKAAPIRAHRLEGRAQAVARRTPLLGREADMAQLELVARRSFDERRPFLVSVVAPAGTGKTRLVEEFLDRLPSLAPEATVAVAQCLPYGQRLTYWPLRAVLFRLTGLEEDESPEALRAELERWLHAAGVEEPGRTAALLAATVGAAEVEGIDLGAVFEAWRTAIEAAAHKGPLVVVFEDLHWSSDSLLDLVDYVLQPRGDLPLLMLVMSRPELLDRRAGWGGGRRNYVSLVLEPLPDDLVGNLVGHLLEGAPRGVVNAVVARADGNPFYAGELVRALVDRVGPEPDPEAIESALATLPDSVQAAVLARLDLLPPAPRRAIQVGSVFGRGFRPSGLAAVEPALAGEAGAACEALVARDLVRPAEATSYAFRHILIREVAYGTLPRAERARLHDAAGRWVESTTAGREDAYAELIAYHAREAALLGQALDQEGVEALSKRAIQWLMHAGDAALAAGANVEALRHYRSGAELASGHDLLDLQIRIGDTRVDGATSVEAYERALDIADSLEVSADIRLRTLAGLLELYMRAQGSVPRRPSVEKLEDLLLRGRHLLDDPEVTERTRALFLIVDGFRPFWYRGSGTRHHSWEEDIAAARETASQGVAIAERLDDARLISAGLDAISSLAMDAGDFVGSRRDSERRIAMQERLPLDERIDAYAMVAWNSTLLGDLAAADARARAGLAQVRPGQVPNWIVHLRAWQAYALVLAGRWDEAFEAMDGARELWLEIDQPPAGYAVRGFIAVFDAAIGRRDEDARERYRQTMLAIVDQFDGSTPVQRLRQAYPRLDFEVFERELGVVETFGAPDLIERILSRMADTRRFPPPVVVERVTTAILLREANVLQAQAERVRGLATGDAEALQRSISAFEAIGAVPSSARARCELALLTGDESLMAAGLADLERIGDAERVLAYEQAARAG